MDMRHVAMKGAQAGRWVPCRAKQCRNTGLHAEYSTLQAARLWKESHRAHLFPLGKLTKADVEKFLTLSSAIQELWTSRALIISNSDGRVNKTIRR